MSPKLKPTSFLRGYNFLGLRSVFKEFGSVNPSLHVKNATDSIQPVLVPANLGAIYVVPKNTKVLALSLNDALTVGAHMSLQVFSVQPDPAEKMEYQFGQLAPN